jgi:hypothetical protein
MEKVKTYQKILLSFLEDYSKITYANAPNLEQQILVDTKRNHFQLVSVGWQKGKFIYDVVFPFDIKNGQIWIQQNWTDLKLRQELVDRGVFLLGFHRFNNRWKLLLRALLLSNSSKL